MIATVFDLQASICSAEGVPDFDSLQIGPLMKMPLVQDLFQLPADQQDIMQVTADATTAGNASVSSSFTTLYLSNPVSCCIALPLPNPSLWHLHAACHCCTKRTAT